MDIDISSIEKNFIRQFVLEEYRDQVSSELKNPETRILFTKKLSKNWESILDIRLLKPMDKEMNINAIKKEMEAVEWDLCYVISNDPDIDGKVMDINYAFSKVYGRGFVSIVMNLVANNIYLEIESKRFSGKNKS